MQALEGRAQRKGCTPGTCLPHRAGRRSSPRASRRALGRCGTTCHPHAASCVHLKQLALSLALSVELRVMFFSKLLQ